VPYLWSKVKLANALQAERGRNDYLKDALAGAIAGSNGWQGAVESLGYRVDDLRHDLSELRQMQTTAVRYIADLIAHIKDGLPSANMPVVPLELREGVNRHLGAS
jgi:hypothetical protein